MPDRDPLAGEPRDRKYRRSGRARMGAWLVWWVLLMSLWIMLDDSLAADELLAGVAAAALAALVAELASYQAATRFRMRIRWLVPALRLPGQVIRDTVTVYAALWRRLARGEQPDSAFVTEPVRFGDDTPAGVTRRVLLIGARSVAPNAFALGIDPGAGTMVLHQLVAKGGDLHGPGVHRGRDRDADLPHPGRDRHRRGDLPSAVVAYEFITAVMVMVLALLAQAFQRSSLFELPVLLALLMFGGGLVFGRAVERWL